MVSTLAYNPVATNNAAGTFGISWDGLIQGTAFDDPSSRNYLAGGFLATAETLPMWGGIAIAEHVPAVTGVVPDPSLGGSISRATTVTANLTGTVTGFSVFDQNHSAVITPTSQVPLVLNGMTMNFYRMGSNARIAVACDPSLVSLTTSSTGIISPLVSWDFNAQILQPYDASTATISVTSQTATFNAGTGIWTVAVVAGATTTVGAVGDSINLSGATNSGTGGTGLVNGNKTVTVFTDSTHFSYQVVAPAGAIGTIAGTQLLNFGVGALNVRVLKVQPTNCMTVQYDPVTGFATWNRNGACAVILI